MARGSGRRKTPATAQMEDIAKVQESTRKFPYKFGNFGLFSAHCARRGKDSLSMHALLEIAMLRFYKIVVLKESESYIMPPLTPFLFAMAQPRRPFGE